MPSPRILKLVELFRQGAFQDDTLPADCATCGKTEGPEDTFIPCSGCSALKYCNKQCAAASWDGIITINGRVCMTNPHRKQCALIKDCVKKAPEMREIAKQLPWAREQADGTFAFDVLQASKDLLGSGPEFGWWTDFPECGCCSSRYTWGFMLLENEHIQESVGWKHPNDHIPSLNFGLDGPATPKILPSFDHTWASYYEWRRLPLDSPAALLLHWPMTVYRLLHLLGLIPTRPPKERRHLTVHLLGIEKELDFLPLFGELALLLPNTDLDLVLFGPGVANLLAKAKENPNCIASRPFVYTYSAPQTTGEGTIRIALSRRGRFWDGSDLTRLRAEKPDAMVAMNAGLTAYESWRPTFLASRALAIPFAVTDYLEISLRINIQMLRQLTSLQKMIWSGVAVTSVEQQRVLEAEDASYAIELNPFMCLGPRPQALNAGPWAVNGHTMVVTPGVLAA